MAALLAGIGAVLIPVSWWSSGGGTVRSVLEGSPLSSSVAKVDESGGSPITVGIVMTVLVAGAVIGISIWRRKLAVRVARRTAPGIALFAVSLLRTIVLLGGVTLIPVAVAIAMGEEVPSNPDAEPLTGLLPIGIVALGIVSFTFWSSARCFSAAHDKQAASGT